MRTLLISGLAVALMSLVAFGAPLVGTFKSPDLGNDFLNGRWSESHVGGGAGQIGNAVHAGSWDGTALFGQWELSAPAISAAPSLVYDSVDGSGNGIRVYVTTYAGGTLALHNNGPWWNPADAPASQYIVNVQDYRHTTTKQYLGGVEQTFTTSVNLNGTFQGFPGSQVSFIAGVAAPTGSGISIPADYPAFVGANAGVWGVVQKITLQVVPEPASLALVAMGAVALLRRRR